MKHCKHIKDMSPEMRLIDKYLRIARRHRVVMERRLNSTGVYRSQHRILMFISDNPNISQKELARMTEVSTATIAVSLKKLEKGGYIKRVVDEKDNRYNQLCITEKGKAVIEESHQIFREVDKAMFEGLSEEEYQTLEKLLDHVYGNLEEYEKKWNSHTAEREET